MDELDGVPCSVLGYHIKTRTQICLTCCVTASLELLIYIVVICADCAVIVQHFRDANPLFAWLTVLWMVLPAVVSFTAVITSPWHWPGSSSDTAAEVWNCGWAHFGFVLLQLANMVFFPVGAIYRLARRIFWSVEAMFQERDSRARHLATAKAAETSAFELYHFLQAFLHAAPQIMLQFAVLMREDIFRNYETTHMQVLSICASLITMAIVTGTYQRFESQHIVGRNYPWSSRSQIAWRRDRFRRTTQPMRRIGQQQSPTMRLESAAGTGYTEVPASEHVLRRFAASHTPSTTKSLHLGEYNINSTAASDESASDDENVDKIRSFLRTRSIESNMDTVDIDSTPIQPPPPPPPMAPPLHLGLPSVGSVMNRMSTIRDMMLLKTELYLRDNVPRLPPNLHLLADAKPDNVDKAAPTAAVAAESLERRDSILPMPTRRRTIEGLEQDDFLGKAVSFTAWTLVLLQRMFALSAFAYFHPVACALLVAAHYALMLTALLIETRFAEKPERITFYLFLAYVYVFSILELRIKFRHPRRWFVGYAALVMAQNVAMSVWWFGRRQHGSLAAALVADREAEAAASVSAAWWFGFMFAAVLLSGTYAMMCWVVYYYLLRPSARVLFEARADKAAAVEDEVRMAGGRRPAGGRMEVGTDV